MILMPVWERATLMFPEVARHGLPAAQQEQYVSSKLHILRDRLEREVLRAIRELWTETGAIRASTRAFLRYHIPRLRRAHLLVGEIARQRLEEGSVDVVVPVVVAPQVPRAALKDLSVPAYANGMTIWHYKARDVSLDDVCTPDYFCAASEMMKVGDFMLISALDGCRMMCVAFADGERVVLAGMR